MNNQSKNNSKCDFDLFFIFNNLSVNENGGTSLRRRTPEFFRGSLDALLGLYGDSREWRYLNKGTHEENDWEEFDRYTVQVIITNLEQLDVAMQR